MGAAQDQLKVIIARAEHIIDNEINPAKEILKEVYAEAKATGFDTKTLRKLVALRAKDPEKRKEEQAILELYAHAAGLDLF